MWTTRHFAWIAACLTPLLLAGCTATLPYPPIETAEPAPGLGEVLLAVPGAAPAGQPSRLELQIGDEDPLWLRAGALNRLLLPPGWHRFVLPRLEQDPQNRRTAHLVQAASRLRLVLVEDQPEGEAEARYKIVPISEEGLRQLALEADLERVNLAP